MLISSKKYCLKICFLILLILFSLFKLTSFLTLSLLHSAKKYGFRENHSLYLFPFSRNSFEWSLRSSIDTSYSAVERAEYDVSGEKRICPPIPFKPTYCCPLLLTTIWNNPHCINAYCNNAFASINSSRPISG